jgi:anti-sigma regulatory factor (Ser/Thr protein kinase)
MFFLDSDSLPITDSSHVSAARRAVLEFARRANIPGSQAEKAALITTELGTNLVKHAKAGELLLQAVGHASDLHALHLIAVDKGPGMANLRECLSDGYSTAGSPGTGLGAIRRLSDDFDIYSQPGRGTVVWSRWWSRSPTLRPGVTMDIGSVSRPKRGEAVCGDHWSVIDQQGRWQFIVADGLGHGPQASEASTQAARIFDTARNRELPELLNAIHAGLRSTRGAAVSIADIEAGRQLIRYAGVGNVAGEVLSSAGTRSMVSLNGTAGVEMRKITEFTYPWSEEAVLVLHSDGLSSRWNIDQYPGLLGRHPTVIAGVLYRDHDRGYDDVTIVTVKQVSV